MEPSKFILPQNSLKDTLAILVILLSLPTPLSFIVFTLFILTSSSKKFASRVFTKFFGSSSNLQVSIPNATNNPNKEEVQQNRFISPLLLICSIDIILGLLLRFMLPRFMRYFIVLANAVISCTLCGNNLWNSCFATISIAVFENLLKIIISYTNYSLETDFVTPQLFPYLPKNSMPFSYFLYSMVGVFKIRHKIEYFYFWVCGILLNFLNLVLSIHIVLMVFASISRKNFISRNINQLTNLDQDLHYSPFSTFLLNKEKEEKTIKLIEIELDDFISNSNLIINEIEENEDEETPASYPKNSVQLVSTSSIVQDNFEVFCRSSFTKPKNSVKSVQPLWSLIATMKAMTLRKDVYSGSVQIDEGDNNSLVLSDTVSKYDEYELRNYTDGFKREKILIFIDYIGETLIGFQLKNLLPNDVIVIRVNGLIWYQVSSGFYNNEQYFIVGGLTPLSQYDIQFLTEEIGENGQKRIVLIDDLIVSTVNSNGDTTNNTNNNGKVPLSPLTTLRGSLVTTNENLNKERTKLKKTKKEISKKVSSYKQDIELLKSKISNSDKNDEKNWKKVLSLRSSVKQVEEDVSKIEIKMNQVQVKENEISEIYTVEKRKFDLVLRNHQQFKNKFNDKVSVKKQLLTGLNTDIEAIYIKKDKIQNKLDKLTKECEKFDVEIKELYDFEISNRLNQRKKRSEKRSSLLTEFKEEIKKQESAVEKLKLENETLKS